MGRIALVNLPSASVLSNNVARSYRAEWSWTFRLLPDLTATQSNSVVASYNDYPFNGQNNRLTLDYTTTTTLDAVLTPRLTVDLNHFAESQQAAITCCRRTGRAVSRPRTTRRTTRSVHGSPGAPVTGVSLAIEPRYRLNRRLGTVNGCGADEFGQQPATHRERGSQHPARETRKAEWQHGRFYQDDLSRSFGTTLSNVKSQADNWTSNLQLTWHL